MQPGNMIFYFILFFLIAALYWVHCIVHARDNDKINSNVALRKLQYTFFIVYFPATFADWLQGPYLYKLYNLYGFKDEEIFLLYIAGFASGVCFGTCVSGFADYFGRKKLCIIFNIIYSISCLTKVSTCFEVLFIGRVLGGVGTSILFSVFEAWYIHQHIEKHQFPVSWISNTLSKTTFYNGLLAIVAGLVSNIFAEWFELGPVFPFLLAVPCLILSGTLAAVRWDETCTLEGCQCLNTVKAARNLIRTKTVLLCIIQSVFESVMYVFIILWTPVLSPISPPLGVVFSCFMICIMIGSTMYSWLISKNCTPNMTLTATMLLGSLSLGMCVVAELMCQNFCSYLCFLAFLLYEVAVGLYYPAIGFIRSCVIPERYRAGLTSWFRVPMNIITCVSLFYFRHSQFKEEHNGHTIVTEPVYFSSNVQIFSICALTLLGACGLSRYLQPYHGNSHNLRNVYDY